MSEERNTNGSVNNSNEGISMSTLNQPESENDDISTVPVKTPIAVEMKVIAKA